MQTNKLNRRHVTLAVHPSILIALALQNAIENDKNFFQKNPGAVAMIRTLGLSEEELGDKIIHAMNDAGRFDKHTTDRVANAEQYIGNVARFLNPAGRAWGIYMNCCLANAKPDVLTQTQTEIFGHGEQVKPLMSLQGVTDFINAFARAEVQIDEQTKRTLAQLALDQVSSFGSPDNNVVAALLPSAIQTRGQLTEQTLVQVVKGLRHEAANPQKSVPSQVIETSTQYPSSYAQGNGAQQDAQRGRHQARA